MFRFHRIAAHALAALAFGAVFFPFTATSAQPVSEWRGIETAEVRLIQGHAGQSGETEIAVGLEFVMAPGWKVYWRSPGDAGFPPIPNFTGTTNFADHRVEWPIPKRFTYYGLQTFGYENRVVLPVLIKRQNPGEPVPIKLDLSYAACADICVPVNASLTMTVPAGPQKKNRHGRAIARGLADAPPRSAHPLGTVAARYVSDRIEVTARAEKAFNNPEVILEGPDAVAFGKPTCSTSPAIRELTCTFPFQGRGRPSPTETTTYTLTISHNQGWAAETVFKVPAAE